MFEEIMIAIGHSVSDVGSSDDKEHGDDTDEKDTELGKRSDDDEPGWVVGTISQMVWQRVQKFRQKYMTLDCFTPPGWWDADNYIHEGDMEYCTADLKVPAVISLETDEVAAALAPTTFGELLESLSIIQRKLLMLHGTSRPGSRHISVCSANPHSNKRILSHFPDTNLHLSPSKKMKTLDGESIYPSRLPSELVTIWKSDSDEQMVMA
jgi:hypothetical protein